MSAFDLTGRLAVVTGARRGIGQAMASALGADLAARARPVDILVNKAGTIRLAPAAEHTDTDWDLVLQVNLNAQFALSRAVSAAMVARVGNLYRVTPAQGAAAALRAAPGSRPARSAPRAIFAPRV